MTVTVFGSLIFIRAEIFTSLILHFLLSFSLDREGTSNIQDSVCIQTRFVKNPPLRVVFSTLFSVFGNVVKLV